MCLAAFEVPHEAAQVLIEGLESDLGASLVEALWVLDRLRDGHAVLVPPHLSAEDLLAAFVDSHTVSQIRKLASSETRARATPG